jgi:hypothetical protein
MKGWLGTMNKRHKKTLSNYNEEKAMLNDMLNKKMIILGIIPRINGIKFPIYSNMDCFFKKLQKIFDVSDFKIITKRSSIIVCDHEIFLGATFGSVDDLDKMFINWNNFRR